MNINQNDVSKIYKAYILDKIPKSRKNCPSTNKIIKAFKSKYSEKEKTKIVDHITNCCFCIHEFDFILQYLRY